MKKILSLSTLCFILCIVTSLLCTSNLEAQAPQNPQVIPDYSQGQALVVYVNGRFHGLERLEEIYNKALNCNLPLVIISTKTQSTQPPIPELKKRSNVKVVIVDENAYGAGFARDNLPLTIRTANGCKYLWGNPTFGKEMLDALKKAKYSSGKPVLDKSKVIKTPFQFDGGDMTIGEIGGKKYVFVTENFCQRNTPKGQQLNFAKLTQQLKAYLGVDEVVKLQTPPTMGKHDSHSDFFVRPLPPCGESKGKVAVSSADVNTPNGDKKALEENVQKLKKKFGEGNVVVIPAGEGNPKYSYANTVVVKTSKCCLILVPQYFDGDNADVVKGVKEYLKKYKLSLNTPPADLINKINKIIENTKTEPDFDLKIIYDLYAMKQYDTSIEQCCKVVPIGSYDTAIHGGAVHCRVGNLFIGPCVKPNGKGGNNNGSSGRKSRGRGRGHK